VTGGRRKTIVYGTLVIAIIWGIHNNPLSPQKKTAMDAEPDPMPLSSSQSLELETDMQSTGTLSEMEFIGWKDDPFVRKAVPVNKTDYQPEPRMEFDLSAISMSGDRSMAVINGKIVQRDGKIEDWVVARIDDNSVLMCKGPDEITLKLKGR
jgi:hypothetical protein